jgi:hypothetical protein
MTDTERVVSIDVSGLVFAAQAAADRSETAEVQGKVPKIGGIEQAQLIKSVAGFRGINGSLNQRW